MPNITKFFLTALATGILCSCANKKDYDMGTYGYDSEFLKKHNIGFFELVSKDKQSRILIVPSFQGRVMTSTSSGNEGNSYGWINYKLIESGKKDPQFNPVGGEERFWFGPEGGPFSLYFKKGQEQVYENWIVPPVIDTETYDIANKGGNYATFTKKANLTNASGTDFTIDIERKISLLEKADVMNSLGIDIPEELNMTAYRTDNKITNAGTEKWSKEKGLVSVWLLGMFTPTPTTTVFIPYKKVAEGAVVNDEYFGKVPSDRLIDDNDGMLYFKIDGKHRSKIGIPATRAKELCGSYDTEKKVLTLLWCSIPSSPLCYLNGQWGDQKNPYEGDVINSYNDGPVGDGSVMGPFYEIETSSPGAELSPRESLTHSQIVIHIQGDEKKIDKIVKTLFGTELSTITSKFR